MTERLLFFIDAFNLCELPKLSDVMCLRCRWEYELIVGLKNIYDKYKNKKYTHWLCQF